jgi:hypothetical protein
LAHIFGLVYFFDEFDELPEEIFFWHSFSPIIFEINLLDKRMEKPVIVTTQNRFKLTRAYRSMVTTPFRFILTR